MTLLTSIELMIPQMEPHYLRIDSTSSPYGEAERTQNHRRQRRGRNCKRSERQYDPHGLAFAQSLGKWV